MEFPPAYEESGVRIVVDGLYRLGDTVVGVTGMATNTTNADVRQCTVNFDVVDQSGVKVGDAVASTLGLKPGQQWRFQAAFTIPFQHNDLRLLSPAGLPPSAASEYTNGLYRPGALAK